VVVADFFNCVFTAKEAVFVEVPLTHGAAGPGRGARLAWARWAGGRRLGRNGKERIWIAEIGFEF
jgi:hypothetical protein